MDSSQNRLRQRNIVMALLVILMPALQALVIALVALAKNGTALPSLAWNDEAMYYALIKTWTTKGAHTGFGSPIGYYGFNGGRAMVGTGSAWHWAVILPYVIFANMFGLNYHTIYFANITFLVLAQIIFILLVKPDFTTKIRLLLISAFSAPVILYISTEMSEPMRYAFTIVLAGMMIKLITTPVKDINKVLMYVVIPLYIIFLAQVYIFFVFVIPIYIFAILKDKKVVTRILSSIVALGVVGGGSYLYLQMISSNYNIYKTRRLFDALSAGDIKGAIVAGLGLFKEGIADLISITLGRSCHGLITWFVLLLGALVILGAIGLTKNSKGVADKGLYGAGVASILIFTTAFIGMYSLDPNTFFRSNSIVLLFAIYLYSSAHTKRIFEISLIGLLIGMFFVPANLSEYNVDRYISDSELASWEALSQEFEKVILVKPDEAPAASTAVLYTLEPRVIAAMPAGSGINLMLRDDRIIENAQYLVFTKHKDNLRSDWLEQSYDDIRGLHGAEIDESFEVAFENEEYILMKHKK